MTTSRALRRLSCITRQYSLSIRDRIGKKACPRAIGISRSRLCWRSSWKASFKIYSRGFGGLLDSGGVVHLAFGPAGSGFAGFGFGFAGSGLAGSSNRTSLSCLPLRVLQATSYALLSSIVMLWASSSQCRFLSG